MRSGYSLFVTAFLAAIISPGALAQPTCDRDHFIYAVEHGDTSAAVQAIKNGCHPDSELDASGATALMWAKNDLMVRALLQAGANADYRNTEGTNALSNAAYRADEASVRTLLAAGARADAQGRRGCGPLCEAAASNSSSPGIVRALLDAGASVNTTDCWNRNALFTSGVSGKADVLATLLDKGPDVNVYETYGGDPLLVYVAQGGSANALDMLAKHGAKIDWPNARSCATALHAAARRGQLSAAKRLVELGADLRATDSKGKTARGIAMENGHTAVAAFLESRNTPVEGPIRTDCISVADLPDAAKAWKRAAERTRAASCSDVTGATLGVSGGGGR